MTAKLCLEAHPPYAGPLGSVAASARASRPMWAAWATAAPVTLAVAATSFVILLCPTLGDWLQLDRRLIGQGQLWRLVTCHLTHWGREHYLWDVLVFLVLGLLCEPRLGRAFAWRLAACAAAISATVLAVDPNLLTYRGLSGLDTWLYVLAAGTFLRDSLSARSRAGVLMCAALSLGVAAKIAYECLTGDTLFVQSGGFAVAQSGHLAGAAMGLLCVYRAW